MLSQNHFPNQAHKFLVIDLHPKHVLTTHGWGFSYECHLKGKALMQWAFSWWVFWVLTHLLHLTYYHCHLSLHVSKQRDLFFFTCVLKDDSIPLIQHHFCEHQCPHPHDFHTHTHGVLQASNFPIAKKVSGWSSCNTKFDVVWFFFGTFVSMLYMSMIKTRVYQ
jgi:hypothetical protein